MLNDTCAEKMIIVFLPTDNDILHFDLLNTFCHCRSSISKTGNVFHGDKMIKVI